MFRSIRIALLGMALGALLGALAAGPVLAGNPSGTGQPNANCETSAMMPPGFATAGFANAGSVYAGSGPGSAHANSGDAVSQYDVACYQISLHH